jgi:hypothetical protein
MAANLPAGGGRRWKRFFHSPPFAQHAGSGGENLSVLQASNPELSPNKTNKNQPQIMKTRNKSLLAELTILLRLIHTGLTCGLLRKASALLALLAASTATVLASEDLPTPVFSLKTSEGIPPLVQDEGSWGMPLDLVLDNGPETTFTASSNGGYLTFPAESRAGIALKDSETLSSLSGPFTIAMWVNPKFDDMRMAELVSAGGDSGEVESFRLRYSGYYKSIEFSSGGANPQLSVKTKPKTVPLNTWSHVAVVSEGGRVILYVNHIPSAEAPLDGVNLTPKLGKGQFLTLGNYIGRKDRYQFVGDLAGVRIFDRALNSSQIERLANEYPE